MDLRRERGLFELRGERPVVDAASQAVEEFEMGKVESFQAGRLEADLAGGESLPQWREGGQGGDQPSMCPLVLRFVGREESGGWAHLLRLSQGHTGPNTDP